MGKRELFDRKYNPPFYLHKINNYQKAVYERKGHWTEKEKVKYGVFLEIYRKKFEDRENPILNKMFRVMSDFIKTRNHNQCRSHHQKMERQRFEIDSILESIRSKYHPRQYELFFEKYSRHIQALNLESVLNEKGLTPHRNVEKRKKQQIKYEEIYGKTLLNKQVKLDEQYDSIIKINGIQNNKEELSNEEINLRVEENKLTAEKLLIEIQEIFQVKQDKQISQIVSKQQYFIEQKQYPPKEAKQLKKTGLEYDSDSDNFEEKPEAIYVDIPMEAPFTNQNGFMAHNMNINLVSQYQHSQNLPQSHISMNQFGTFHKLQSQVGQGFPLNTAQYGFEQNYAHSMKQLDEKKKWHLNEAGRLCNEMNEHLQQANMCDQMKEAVLQQMMNLRRQFYIPSQYARSQF